MNVLVTGGAGFIGANLCRHLTGSSRDTAVVALDDLSTGRRENLDGIDGVDLVVGSMLDQETLDEVVPRVDAIVHLGARPSVPLSLADPMATHVANATGTMQVLEAARRHGGRHVVLASSSSVYGANPELPKREDMLPMPVSPYAASKLATESYALSYARSFGLPVLAYRFFNVFGPLQPAGHAYAAVVPAFVSSALGGHALPVHGDGRQTRDFTYVGSVVEVLAESVHRSVSSLSPVNLAFGSRVSLLELIDVLERLLGTPLERDHLETRPGDVRDSQADQTQLRALFPGLEPVGLATGLQETIDWFRSLG